MSKIKEIKPYRYWERFFECECAGEGILVSAEYYEELNDSDGLEYPEITLAYWGEGFNGRKLSLGQKLRLIWQIIKTGKPWNDMVCLTPEMAKELGEHLVQFSKKKPRKRKKK